MEDLRVRRVLNDPTLYSRLLQFARARHMAEYVLFWKQVDEFERLESDSSVRISAAQRMVEHFLTNGSETEVTLDAKMTAQVRAQVMRGVADFGPLKREAEWILEAQLFVEFSSLMKRDADKKGAARNSLIVSLLVERAGFGVLFQLIQLQSSTEDEELISSVVEVLVSHSVVADFAQFALQKEVATCKDPNTLFRDRGVLVWVYTSLLKELACRKWVLGTLERVVKVAEQSGSSLKVAKFVLTQLRQGAGSCPPYLKLLLQHVSHASASEFPEMRWVVLGSFVFLRWVGPLLVDPVLHGLCRTPPSERAKAVLRASLGLLLGKGPQEGHEESIEPGTLEEVLMAMIDTATPCESILSKGQEMDKVSQILGLSRSVDEQAKGVRERRRGSHFLPRRSINDLVSPSTSKGVTRRRASQAELVNIPSVDEGAVINREGIVVKWLCIRLSELRERVNGETSDGSTQCGFQLLEKLLEGNSLH